MIYIMMIDTPEEKRTFAIIYEKYKFLMMKVARDVLQDDFLAEDAVHEAFIKIAKNIERIKDTESHETKRYLITITKNAAIDIYRKRRIQMKKEILIDEFAEADQPLTYMETDVESAVLDVLKNLPVKYRDIFILKYSNHLSNAEIANLFGMKEGTVRQRIARGKVLIEHLLSNLEAQKNEIC